MGSGFLVVENRRGFSGMSGELGKRYSTNGDMLSFLVKSTRLENGKRVPRNLAPYFGTAITRGLTIGAEDPVGFLLEEWGNPYFTSWIVELSGIFGFLRRALTFLKLNLAYQLGFAPNANISSAISAVFGESITSMSSIPTIAMGQEPPAGTFSPLERMHRRLVWA